jgi:hypothetical protein
VELDLADIVEAELLRRSDIFMSLVSAIHVRILLVSVKPSCELSAAVSWTFIAEGAPNEGFPALGRFQKTKVNHHSCSYTLRSQVSQVTTELVMIVAPKWKVTRPRSQLTGN